MVMWDEIAAEVAKDFPDVKCDKMLVDAMTCRSKCAGSADTLGGPRIRLAWTRWLSGGLSH